MTGKLRDFGGVDRGDDQAALLNPGNKPLTQIVQDDSFREFEFRQYLFSCQSKVCKAENPSFDIKWLYLKKIELDSKFIVKMSFCLLCQQCTSYCA